MSQPFPLVEHGNQALDKALVWPSPSPRTHHSLQIIKHLAVPPPSTFEGLDAPRFSKYQIQISIRWFPPGFGLKLHISNSVSNRLLTHHVCDRSPSKGTLQRHIVLILRFVIFDLVIRVIRLGSHLSIFNSLGINSSAEHGRRNTTSGAGRRPSLLAVRASRGDDDDRRPGPVRHGSDRHQHLLLQPLRQNGRLYVNWDSRWRPRPFGRILQGNGLGRPWVDDRFLGKGRRKKPSPPERQPHRQTPNDERGISVARAF